MATFESAKIEIFPAANSADNAHADHVIGNKQDAAVTSVGTTKSVIAYVKGILTNLNLVKAKTDTIDLVVPAKDDATNATERDVIGNKSDSLVNDWSSNVSSIMSFVKGLAQLCDGIFSYVGTFIPFWVKKIDDEVTDGLTGVEDSLAYRVHEIERHFHNWESQFGIATTPTSTHKADRIGPGVAPFVLTTGNNDWGSWVQILGALDTPARNSNPRYDIHEIITTANSNASPYFIQIGFGTSGADALTAGTYSEKVLNFTTINDKSRFLTMTDPVDDHSLAWARIMIPGVNNKTLSFYFGIHEYEG